MSQSSMYQIFPILDVLYTNVYTYRPPADWTDGEEIIVTTSFYLTTREFSIGLMFSLPRTSLRV